jgi:hypothetical protein
MHSEMPWPVGQSSQPYDAKAWGVSSYPQHELIAETVASYDWLKVLVSTSDESGYEGETLSQLHDLCLERTDLQAVGYIHTKGIRHYPHATVQTFRAVNSWRHFLEWGTIDRWRDCISRLQGVDAVGVNFRDSPWPHFSGNFWWANASYLRTLDPPIQRRSETPRDTNSTEVTQERINYEMWVGLNNPTTFSFFDFPFHLPGREWTYGFDLYRDDIYPLYELNGL